MGRKIRILVYSMILTFLLGSMVVHAEDGARINYTKYTVNIGDEDNVLQLKMENQGEGDKKPRWISYNANIASVDQDGVVTPLRKGKTIISSGIGFPRKTCVITVVDPSVKLNKTAVTLYRSANKETPGNTISLTAKVNGATKKATDVVWSSSNENIAKVVADNRGKGVVTAANAPGTAVITARVNGRTASCKVSVVESAISLNVDNMQLSTKGVGSSIKLLPTVVGAKKSVTWTSSDTNVAKVSGGKVTGKKAGTATVTAKANGVETTCEVTVVEGQISINEEKVLLYTEETKALKTNASASDAVEWTSNDVNVVKVEGQSKGKAKITAVGPGKATITATCNGKTDTCVVEVKNISASIAEKIVHLKTKGVAKTYTLNYQVDGRKNTVKWSSSNTKVVSVSKGKLTGKKAGIATVSMTANGVTDEVQIIVQDYTPTISLNQKEYTLYTNGKGNSVALKASIDGASKTVEWQSNAPAIAEVNAKGKVTAKGEGRALITAKANGVTAKCFVNVIEPKIIMDKNELVIKPQESLNLCEYASIEVIGASQSISYKSSDAKTVSVNGKGVINARKTGSATITLKANGAKDKTFIVTVSDCSEHMFGDSEILKNPTCEENGLSVKTCTVCGGKQQEVIAPKGHSFGKWTVTVKATENAAGLQRRVCTACGAEDTRTIPAKNKGESAYGYKLEWEDDFDGTELDRSVWNVEEHDPGWVNEELQEYVDSSKNIYVENGNLVIKAFERLDENNNPIYTERDGKQMKTYTSGRINTQNKKNFMYGRFEARAKVPSGKGFLPAFWMMPADESYYGQWPKCGEIDIMEVLGDQTDKVHSTLHFGEPHTQKQGTYTLENGDFSKDFHVYACEWDPDEFRFYVDGQLFYTENDWFTKKPGFGAVTYPAPYDQPFYMILNLAVGGSWVGYPDDTTQFDGEDDAQLVVDYVRVYQKDEYDTDVDRPDTEVKLRDPDNTGNYIINGDFAKEEDLATGDENWQLLLTGGGDASTEIKDSELHITTQNEGTLNYSVQIVQAGLPIEKDSRYKLSYDAYADEARTMITDISAPDRGYIRYLADNTVELTTEKKSFEHTFDMKSDSDANGRVEFNLGNQGSTAKVHITNVRLVKDGEAEADVKDVLPDGNYVYNGAFNEGDEGGRLRLAYWDWDIKCKGAGVSVTNDAKRELKIVVPEAVTDLEDVVVKQTPIAIKGGRKYVLSFDAYADKEKTIKATIAGNTFESKLTTEKTEYRYEFETDPELSGSELRFLLGAAGITYIDNVCIREDKMIVNGDFSSGMTGFEVYVADDAKVSGYIVDSLNEEDAFSIDITDTADMDWKIQLKQNNIKLEKDKWYKIAFDAKSTLDRKIMYALQRDGTGDEDWTPYSGNQIIDLIGQYRTFSHTFKMSKDTDPKTILSISMGAVDKTQITTKHTVVIDNITLEETEPVEIPPVALGEEMIKNGDFSEGEAHWENSVTAPGVAEASFADEKAVYTITNVGDEDWHIQLKQADLKLEKGAEYAVKLKIKSSAARTVKYAFLAPAPSYDWYGGEDLTLTADELKEVDYTLKVEDKDTSDKITFVISMGKADDETLAEHTIEIDDISVKKIGGGEEPNPPVAANLIQNGDFSKGEQSWSKYFHKDGETEIAKGTAIFADNKARYEVTNAGAEDWNVQLKQEGLVMEKGASYKLNLKIGSSIDRDVKIAFMGTTINEDGEEEGNAWFGGADISLTADKLKSVSRIVTLQDKEIVGTVAFQVSMGQIGTETLAAHAIEISDISVTKVEEGTEPDEETETEHMIVPPEESGEDPEIPVGTDLIKNGDFSADEDSWSYYFHKEGETEVAKGTATFADNKARYEITNAGAEDWNVQLKQEGLEMEKGASYKLNLKIGSSIDRDVKIAFMGTTINEDGEEEGNAWFGGADISLTADKLKSVSRVIKLEDKEIVGTVAFQVSMGQIGDTQLAAHAIEISDISVTKVEEGTEADEDTETDHEIVPPKGSGEDPEEPENPDVTNLIQNGDFSEGEDSWSYYFHKEGDTEVAKGTVTFADDKARYEIINAGAEDWNVQLKQEGLEMEKGASYKVNFKIGSSIDRDVKIAFMGTTTDEKGENVENEWFGGIDEISLTANKLKSVSRIVKLQDKEIVGTIAFQISMGKIGDTQLASHAIEISDISVTKVEEGTDADEETETDYEITSPKGSEDESDTSNTPDESETPDESNITDEPDTPDTPNTTDEPDTNSLIQNDDISEGEVALR